MTLEDSLKVERKQWLKEGRAEGRIEAELDAVDKLVAEGTFDAKKACEVLGVSMDDYLRHKAN